MDRPLELVTTDRASKGPEGEALGGHASPLQLSLDQSIEWLFSKKRTDSVGRRNGTKEDFVDKDSRIPGSNWAHIYGN